MATNPFGSITLPTQLFLSFALGQAAAPAVVPFAQTITNEAWTTHPVKPPPAIYMAEALAQGQVSHAAAYQWAKEQGFDTAQMDAMVAAANVGPGASYAFELWRRGIIDQAGFDRAVKRMGLEPEWITDLHGLHDVLLSSAELGMMQQQGFIDAARANAEGALQGVTNERQQLRFEASGLPPGIETALAMLRRNIIGTPEFGQIVREGHTKTKYTDELLKLQDQVLSAATYVRAHLKGHIDAAGMHAGGALTGYTPKDLDLWYQTEGRPATVHQIHIGYARGATLPGATNERDAVDTAVAQSDIRREYADLLWAQRYTYPSAFVLRSLTQSGAITEQEAHEALLFSGWEPTFASKVSAAWAGGTGTTAGDPHVAKAQTQLWTTTHSAYKNGEVDQAEVTRNLTTLGVPAGAQTQVLTLWNAERDTYRKQLTPTQLKKAWRGAAINPATGAAWTKDEVLAALIARGYSPNDANTFLEL